MVLPKSFGFESRSLSPKPPGGLFVMPPCAYPHQSAYRSRGRCLSYRQVGPRNCTSSPLQIPDVSLSTHPARANPSSAAFPPPSDAEMPRLLPYSWPGTSLSSPFPFALRPLQPLPHDYGTVPPSIDASLLFPFTSYAYRLFASHHRPGSHVLCVSPDQARAHCTLDATKTVSRCRLRRSGESRKPSILT